MRVRLFWCFLLLGVTIGRAWSQPVRAAFVRLGEAEGLSHPVSTDILQDRQGFVWIGTQDGLNRFDGYRFRTFPAGEAGLGNAYVHGLAEGSDGSIWVGTDYGLARFDPRTERFTMYRPNTGPGSLPGPRINALLVCGQELLIGTHNAGLCRLDLRDPASRDPRRARFQSLRPGDGSGLRDSIIQNLTPAPDGRVWVGTRHGIQRYDPRTRRFDSFPGLVAGEWSVWDIWVAGPHLVWLASVQGLFTLDPATGHYERQLGDVDLPFYGVMGDPAGNLWVGTGGGGAYCLPASGGPPHVYQTDPTDPTSLGDDDVITLLADRAGSVWFATGGGVSRYDPWRQLLRDFRAANGRMIRFPDLARAMAEDSRGNLWIAASRIGRLARIDPALGTVHDIPLPPSPPGQAATGNATYTMAIDPQQRLWLGTTDCGARRYDPAANQWFYLSAWLARRGINGFDHVNGVDLDAAGRVWVAATTGLLCWDEAADTTHVYRAGPHGLTVAQLLTLRVDPRTNHIWLGTWGGGLNRLDPTTGQMVRYPLDPAQPGALPEPTVQDLLPTPDGLWVGTSGGVYFAKDAAGPFRRIRGLAQNFVEELSRDAHGRVWVATIQGFSVIDGPTGPVHNYSLGASATAAAGIYCTRAGRVVLGTSGGIVSFFPTELMHENQSPGVALTGVDVLNRPVVPGQAPAGGPADAIPLMAAPPYADRLTLWPHQTAVTLHYTGLSFARAERTRYRYRLVGFDHDWVDAGDKRAATYTNLAPGDYRFEVMAYADDGGRPAPPAQLALRVLPPWWHTWWAYGGYALLLLTAVLVAARLWLARQRHLLQLALKEAEAGRLAELDQIKTRFFTNISHEFRTPLTLILGPLEKWRTQPATDEKRRREEDVMRRNARRLLELINQLLDIAKLEAGSLQLAAAPHDLPQLARALTYSFASLAEIRNVQLSFETVEESLTVPLDGDKFEKILTNLISNALKFTPAGGSVRVTVARADGKAVVRVSDTGVGIPADRLPFVFDRFYQVDNSPTRAFEGTGIGLALVKELVQLHGGSVTVVSTAGQGTTFTVSLPLQGASAAPPLSMAESIVELPDFPEAPTADDGLTAGAPATDAAADESLPLLLIVEDHPDVRAYVRQQFDSARFRIAEASDGRAGLQAAFELIPDLVISDLMMPYLDGLDLCRRLRADERTSHIPLILLTARAAVESRLEGLETGADDYLTKPFQPQELLARVANLIAQRERLRRKFSQELREVREIRLDASAVHVASADERFVQKALAVVEARMSEEAFSVEDFADAMAMSRVQLYRKLKALTDQTPTDFIRTLRLRRAAQLLTQQAGNVAEVAYAVGFQNLSYFAKTFKELHGVAPSEWFEQRVERS